MRHVAAARTLLLVVVVCSVAVQAERKFVNLLPSVAPGAPAIGHENGVNGGGKLNQFGKVGVVPSYTENTLTQSQEVFKSQHYSKCCAISRKPVGDPWLTLTDVGHMAAVTNAVYYIHSAVVLYLRICMSLQLLF
jgi:hypothetical protein